tara:strand:- start:71819 stop:72661 length:843 start_codon:yes stop_codon:yes gene_type:complete
VVHVQDYEVDAMFGVIFDNSGSSHHKNGVIRRFIYGVESWLLCRFDRVSSISPDMIQRAIDKGVPEERIIFFPNWAELDYFLKAQRDSKLLVELGVGSKKRVVLYSGNIGEKQGLETLIEAAEQLQHRDDLVFLIVGEGAGKARIIAKTQALKLTNVVFAPLQPYERLPALLASADCHMVVQKRGVADAVLPSKLTNILAVGGNAVITADPDTSLGLLCAEFPEIAVLVEPESVEALVAGITLALDKPLPNKVALAYAQEHLDKEQILRKFEHNLLELID